MERVNIQYKEFNGKLVVKATLRLWKDRKSLVDRDKKSRELEQEYLDGIKGELELRKEQRAELIKILNTQKSINKNYSAYKPIELENTVNSLWKERENLVICWKASTDKIEDYEHRSCKMLMKVSGGLKLIRSLNAEFNRSRKITGELLDKVDDLQKLYKEKGQLSTKDKDLLDELRKVEDNYKELGEVDKRIRIEADKQDTEERGIKDKQLKFFEELDEFYNKLNEEVKAFNEVREQEKEALECFKILEGKG